MTSFDRVGEIKQRLGYTSAKLPWDAGASNLDSNVPRWNQGKKLMKMAA